MNTLHLKHFLSPLVAARGYAPWAITAKHTRELRVLQRRVAAARLGVSWPRQAVRPSLYEDLR